jgi:hypothetical protein
MKTVKKQVQLNLESVSMEQRDQCSWGRPESRFTYEFTGYGHLPNIETLEFFVEVEEPETLAEFRQQKELTKTGLVEWLNKNYKR